MTSAPSRAIFFGVNGDFKPRPVTSCDEEGILVADVDPAVLRAARREFDPVGHYARPDVFRLSVDIQPRPAASFG